MGRSTAIPLDGPLNFQPFIPGATSRHFERSNTMNSHKDNISDVMIHINEPLDAAARASLETAMRQIEGVVSPGFNPGKEHLLIVAFNPDVTHASTLLQRVRASGYSAQLVSM
jgi:hypothetical protein